MNDNLTLNQTGYIANIGNSICPECGTELQHICLTVNPPINKVECPKCGYTKEARTSNIMLEELSKSQSLKMKIKYFEGATKLQKISKGNWIDVFANKDVFVPVDERAMIPLGFALELPQGWEGHLAPRSSTFKTWGIIQTNHVGVIDDSFIGDNDQWHMPVYCLQGKEDAYINGSKDEVPTKGTWIRHGDKIGQFRIMEIMPEIEFEEVESFGNTDRGSFGTTGTK